MASLTVVMERAVEVKSEHEAIQDRQDVWLDKGRELAKQYNKNAWKLADWVAFGFENFNYDEHRLGRSDRWMLIGRNGDGDGYHASTREPNFYRDTAAAVGLSVQTLKNRCFVAGRFSKKKDRIAGLSFSHHAEAASVEDPKKRKQYLLDCFRQKDAKGETLPARPVAWLRAHIAEGESKRAPASAVKRVSLNLPLPMFEKLELLAWDEAKNKKKVDVKAYLAENVIPLLKEFLAARQANIELAKEAKNKRGNDKRRK